MPAAITKVAITISIVVTPFVELAEIRGADLPLATPQYYHMFLVVYKQGGQKETPAHIAGVSELYSRSYGRVTHTLRASCDFKTPAS